MLKVSKTTIGDRFNTGGLTISLFFSIIAHCFVVAGMVYFSYKAIAENKTFVIFNPGKTMQVNILRPGDIGELSPQQEKTQRIKKYVPPEPKTVKKDALPELNAVKKEKQNEIPVVARNVPISKTGTAESTSSGISIGIGTGPASGGIGSGEVFPYTYYVEVLISKLSSNWRVNVLKTSKQRVFDAQIWFRISRNGDLLDSRVLQSSGNEDYDNASMRAVALSGPFPPLPYQYEGKTLAFLIVFHYTVDEGP